MANMVDLSGRMLPNSRYKSVAASQTTAQISVAGDGVPGRDYCSHVIITGTTVSSGVVTLFDGTTILFTHTVGTGIGPSAATVIVDCISDSTKGFNVTTGSSVSCVVVGRFQ